MWKMCFNSVSSKMCLATIVFGSNIKIWFNWLRISTAAIGVTFLDLKFIMYFRKWSKIKLAKVCPGLPSYRVCASLMLAKCVSVCKVCVYVGKVSVCNLFNYGLYVWASVGCVC